MSKGVWKKGLSFLSSHDGDRYGCLRENRREAE